MALVLHAHGGELDEQGAVVGVDRLGQALHLRDAPLLPGGDAVVERAEAELVGGVLLADEEAEPALGAFAVVGDVPVAQDVVLAVGEAVRTGHDPVLEAGRADVQRLPQYVQVRHRKSPSSHAGCEVSGPAAEQ